MVESRCGLPCGNKEYRDLVGCTENNCPGCMSTDVQFWGACYIKNCCHTKGFEYCGECAEMPCEKLVNFAKDDQKHHHIFGGNRIDNLKKWAFEKKE